MSDTGESGEFMPYIDSTKFGEITIARKKYRQVLIIGDRVSERDAQSLEQLFGTTHKIGDWEIGDLLKEKPEVIIIGTGQSGVLKVDEDFFEKVKKFSPKIEIIVAATPQAVEIYNQKIKAGKRANALIHTTC